MAAHLAVSPAFGLALPTPTTIRPNPHYSRCALSYSSLSLLDLIERLLRFQLSGALPLAEKHRYPQRGENPRFDRCV